MLLSDGSLHPSQAILCNRPIPLVPGWPRYFDFGQAAGGSVVEALKSVVVLNCMQLYVVHLCRPILFALHLWGAAHGVIPLGQEES